MSCLVIAVDATLTGSAIDASTVSRNELDEENLIKRQERLAISFREHLTDGQHFGVTGQYRQEFFEEVIDRANDVSFRSRLWYHVADGISQVYGVFKGRKERTII